MWQRLLWIGPESVAGEVRCCAPALARQWTITSAQEFTEADQREACEVVVDAATLDDAAPHGGVLQRLAASPPQGLRRVVTVTTTAWLGDSADPLRAGTASLAVAGARSLALRLAPHATANTIAIAGRFDPARSSLAALATQPDSSTLAHWLAWFCDPDNDYVTGQTINLCGGATLLSSLSV